MIVTTLLSQSYEKCVRAKEYNDEYDLMVDVIEHMGDFIVLSQGQWYIWNETTEGENFAEKWNAHPDRAASFFAWHRKLLADVAALRLLDGLDRIADSLKKSLGEGPAAVAVAHIEKSVSTAREAACCVMERRALVQAY